MMHDFKSPDSVMTHRDRAMLMFVAMASATRLENKIESPAQPLGPVKHFGDVGSFYYDGAKDCISNACAVKFLKDRVASVSLKERPLTNDDLFKVAKVRPILADIDLTKSSYENLVNLFTAEVKEVQAKELEFEKEREDLTSFDKLKAKLKGCPTIEEDMTICEDIAYQVGDLYSKTDDRDVMRVCTSLIDITYDVANGVEPLNMLGDLVELDNEKDNDKIL